MQDEQIGTRWLVDRANRDAGLNLAASVIKTSPEAFAAWLFEAASRG